MSSSQIRMAGDRDNGSGSLPAIDVIWDSDKQTVLLGFDRDQFKTWEFVVAVLDMAKSFAETQRRLATLRSAQEQEAAQKLATSLVRR